MSAVTADCTSNYKGCSSITLDSGRGGGGRRVTMMLRTGQLRSTPQHHLAEHRSNLQQTGLRGAPASSASSSWYQSSRQSPLLQMGLTFCSISFDTSSAVDSRETCQLLRSIPYLPAALCSLARNVISLLLSGDVSWCYLGGGTRNLHPISCPVPHPAKAPCLFCSEAKVAQSSPCLLR